MQMIVVLPFKEALCIGVQNLRQSYETFCQEICLKTVKYYGGWFSVGGWLDILLYWPLLVATANACAEKV